MSFSANVHILISLIFVWEFINILDLLHSIKIEPTWLNTRLVAFTCLTSICLVHGTLLKLGLCIQNTLGALKHLVLALIPVSYGGPFAQKIFVSPNMRGDVRYVTVTKL